MQEKLLVKLQPAAQSEPQTRQSDVGLSGPRAGRRLSLLALPLCPLGFPLGQQAARELMGALPAEGQWQCCHRRLQAASRVCIGKIGGYGTMAASMYECMFLTVLQVMMLIM